MFENLTNKFEEIFSSLKKAPSLNEQQVDEGLRKIRQALLEADVALPVTKELINNIKPKAIGQEIIRSTTPGQMIIKVVYDEIVKIFLCIFYMWRKIKKMCISTENFVLVNSLICTCSY